MTSITFVAKLEITTSIPNDERIHKLLEALELSTRTSIADTCNEFEINENARDIDISYNVEET